MEQNPLPDERKKREEGRQAPEPKKRKGRQGPDPLPEPRGTSKSRWNRTPFLRKERRKKKGDKHRNPSRNQEEPANHDGTEPLSWGKNEEGRRETSTGTRAGTRRSQQIMKEQRPFLARIENPVQLKSCLGKNVHVTACCFPPRAPSLGSLHGAQALTWFDLKAYAWQPGAGQATTFGGWCGKIGPRFSAQTQGGYVKNWGKHNAQCLRLPVWKQAGPMLPCWAKSGACWAMLGPSLAYVGPSRAHVEPCWAHLGPMLAQVGPMLGYVGPILGPCWAYVGPMLACVGPMLAHVEPSWELCRGPVWAIYVETILRCQFFRPEPPPGARNHVKTMFFNIAKMKFLAAEGAETP